MLEGIGDDTALLWRGQTKHGMRLTTTCLTVRKYGAIIASKSRLDQRISCFIVNLALRRISSVDLIIGKLFLINVSCLHARLSDHNLFLGFIHMNDLFAF